jgi:ATP-dependent RNA helicase RhlE
MLKGYDGNCTNWNWKTFAYLLPIEIIQIYSRTLKIIVILVPNVKVVQVERRRKIDKICQFELLDFGGALSTRKTTVYHDVTYWWNSWKNHGFNIRQCDLFWGHKKVVIDEFDEMLNLGFRTQLTAILAMMPRHSFSAATMWWSWCYFEWLFWLSWRSYPSASGTPLENIKQITYNVPISIPKLIY